MLVTEMAGGTKETLASYTLMLYDDPKHGVRIGEILKLSKTALYGDSAHLQPSNPCYSRAALK